MKFNTYKVIYLALSTLIFVTNSISTESLVTINTLQKSGAKLDSIFVNTIDGTLHAISKTDGKIRWSLKEDYVLKVPNDHKKPYFLTDPRDGSLYVFNPRDGIKKFPYTIAELVVASPFRSGDGHFYTGDKRDQWIALDGRTGLKIDSLTSINQSSKISSNAYEQVVYLPRTQYTISMFDAYGNRKFNISYHDFQSQTSESALADHPYYHLTSSSDGLLISIDKKSGKIAWQLRLTHPVVNIYEYKSENLYKIPFAVFSLEALTSLAHESWRYKDLFSAQFGNKELAARSVFTPTLYIGYFDCCNFYALTAFVSNSDIKLIENHAHDESNATPSEPAVDANVPQSNVEIGHHKIPEPYELHHLSGKEALGKDGDSPNDGLNYFFFQEKPQCPASPSRKPKNGFRDFLMQSKYVWSVCAIFATMVFIKVYNKIRQKATDNASIPSVSDSKHSNNESNKSTHSLSSSISMPMINDDGHYRIGKIMYDPKTVLGRGCEGTCVYKGLFEERPVAVKRLLPDCYTLADREVELLRHADQHANVIRYFCTESDSQFRYIALELCQATLQEYVTRNDEFLDKIKPLSLLYQATNGLAHLHNLDIVHRDIKPHNVLISVPNNRGEVIAMISDFGLCKRLDMGNVSFSKRSGITGTEGWIAPELMETSTPDRRITKAIDIFSLGCVYYYVLTLGLHPFGESFRRQMNILTNAFKLDKLTGVNCDSYMQRVLIEKMISDEPKNRPSAPELLTHPVFWSKAKTLQFLQDVSDRIEKIDNDDHIVLNLEKQANVTLKNNWKTHISPELQDDLKKFRSYNGVSVRDLLRAIRNKVGEV